MPTTTTKRIRDSKGNTIKSGEIDEKVAFEDETDPLSDLHKLDKSELSSGQHALVVALANEMGPASPLGFLCQAYLNRSLPMSDRLGAAKAALPYLYQKSGSQNGSSEKEKGQEAWLDELE